MIQDLIALLRPWQWYKNAVIFLAIVFVGKLFDAHSFKTVLLGFIALCLVSSANYILNDVVDRKRDRLHLEKKNRPIADGRVSIATAGILASLLLLGAAAISFFLHLLLLYLILLIFILTTFYSLWLRNEPIADLLVIAVNFVLRALAGTFIINATISPWLVIGTFFLALFLASAKRHGEAQFLKDKAKEHRTTLSVYSKEFTHALMIISTSLLIISYGLASFLGKHSTVIITMPFFLYGVLRYYALVTNGSPLARATHLIFFDRRLLIAGLLWCITTVYVLYK